MIDENWARTSDLALVRDALGHLSEVVDLGDTIARSLASLGPEGEALWEEFSARASQLRWERARDRGIAINSLFNLASRHGWRPNIT